MRRLGLETEYTVFNKSEDDDERSSVSHASPSVRDITFAEERGDLVLLSGIDNELQQPTGHLSWNLWLRNGGRFYADQSTWEYASPECLYLRDLVLADKAGEFIVSDVFSDRDVYITKRSANKWMNSSWGSHENYSLDIDMFNEITETEEITPYRAIMELHFASRIVFTGAGHIHINTTSHEPSIRFWISPRARFMVGRISSNTRGNRGLINLRDESLSKEHREDKRLHVICGDANRSDWSTYLKFGTTRLLLEWLRISTEHERNQLLIRIGEGPPVSLMNRLARTFMRGRDGIDTFKRAVDIQRYILEELSSKKHLLEDEVPDVENVLDLWGQVLSDLPQAIHGERTSSSNKLDWLIKKRLFEESVLEDSLFSLESLSILPGSGLAKRLSSLDFNYHRIGDSDLYRELISRGLISPMASYEEAKSYVGKPPAGRARVRVEFTDLLDEFDILNQLNGFEWHYVDVWFPQISDFRRFYFEDDNLPSLRNRLYKELAEIRS